MYYFIENIIEEIFEVEDNKDYKMKDGDFIINGNNGSTQPMREWMTKRGWNHCDANLNVIFEGGKYHVVIMDCDLDFEYRFEISATMDREKFKEDFIEQMDKAEKAWNEYAEHY